MIYIADQSEGIKKADLSFYQGLSSRELMCSSYLMATDNTDMVTKPALNLPYKNATSCC